MKVKKAIITAAGFGTRMLPITKIIAKEMLPIINIPVLQYLIEEAIKVEIKEIFIIINKQKKYICDYFNFNNNEIEKNKLKEKSRYDLLKLLKKFEVKINFIEQTKILGLGYAILISEKFMNKEPFLVMLGDELLYGKKFLSKQLINDYFNYKNFIISFINVKKNEISKYGIIKLGIEKDKNLYNVENIIEKPKINNIDINNNFAIIGRYILDSRIFNFLRKQNIGFNNEIQLTDALKEYIYKKQNILARKCFNNRYDIGNKIDFLKANIEIGLKNNEIKKKFNKYIFQIIKSKK